MNKKTINDIDVCCKRVFCRVDFNVPMQDGAITDETRIKAALPTINLLLESGAKLILASHMGRPKGEVVEKFSLKPVAARLSEILGKDVKVASVDLAEAKKEVEALEKGEVILLENVRFYAGEEKNDVELAKQFAGLAEIFVNDAFGAAHRAHASTAGIAAHIPAVSGLLMQKELDVLGKAINNPERPFTAIIGGSKVKDKIDVINNLLEKVDTLIIGGGLAYTFLKAQGQEIGTSLVEDDKIELAKEFIAKAESKGVNFLMPVDHVVAPEFGADVEAKIVAEIPAGWMGLDIGPKTASIYADAIAKSKLVVWNGPMGVFEFDKFTEGTKAVATTLAETEGVYSVIGGGDSAAAVEKYALGEKMSHISTGGGASLEFMEGKILPGVEALNDK